MLARWHNSPGGRGGDAICVLGSALAGLRIAFQDLFACGVIELLVLQGVQDSFLNNFSISPSCLLSLPFQQEHQIA
eukprot:5555093-Amphidinium_carterae.1